MDLPLLVDVSNHQGSIDWPQVKASGVVGAFCKSSESTTYTDPYLPYNANSLKDNGMYRGFYHYAQPDKTAADDEASYFVKVVQSIGLEDGDILALDIEEGSGNLSAWVLHFLQVVKYLVGFDAIVYTSPGFINDHGLHYEPLGNNGLWLASWGSQFPAAPSPWPVVAFWQYSASGVIPGIRGAVDLNRFNGPVEVIPKYGKPASATPSPVDMSKYILRTDAVKIVEALESATSAGFEATKTKLSSP